MTAEIVISDVPTYALAAVESVAADRNPALVFLSRLPSHHSRRNMKRYLDQIAALMTGQPIGDGIAFPWWRVQYQHTQMIRARLMESYKPATINVMLSALRGVLKESWRLGLMAAEDYQRAIDIQNVKAETVPSGRDLSHGERMTLAREVAAGNEPIDIRDAAIVGMLLNTGMRRAELVGLDLADYEPESGRLLIREGKGRKQRTVYVFNGARDALADWLTVRGDQPGPLFLPLRKGGQVEHRRLTTQAIYNMLQKRGGEAGLKHFTPHDFRRTVAGELLDQGVDIVTVQKLLGHASVTTTARYDRRPEEVKRQAAAKLHFPYTRKTLV